jgi:peptidoglycan/LPS O-acetylase OafA/YrhL
LKKTTNHTHHIFHPKYRADIDGLRAIAVLSVIIFHAFPNNHIIKAGFIGVDIFFVISGYLISTIIFQSLDEKTFSFREFYAKRIKRIFPALIVVLITCFVFGWFTLFDSEFKELGKHIKSAATYTNNFRLWKESGYFDSASELKPLLHLWSLSIEEQFYIFWPLILWFIHKKKFNILLIILFLIITSFGFHLYKLKLDNIAAFYAPYLRMWELLMGAAVAHLTLYPNRHILFFSQFLDSYLSKVIYRNKKRPDNKILYHLQSILGLALILIGMIVITETNVYPGWEALIFPILGSVFIIGATKQAWVNKRILSNKVLVWFGLISYPLYLWHWPLLSFARIIENGTPSETIRIIVVIISIILAAVTYYAIEKPIRYSSSGRQTIIVLVLALICIGVIGSQARKIDKLELRSSYLKSYHGFDRATKGLIINECGLKLNDKKNFLTCEKDKRGNVKYALIGDSKAHALWSGLVTTSTEEGRWMFIGNPGFQPIYSTAGIYSGHQARTRNIIKVINKNKDIEQVVIVISIRGIFGISDGVTNTNIKTYNYKYLNELQNTANYNIALDGINETTSRFIQDGKKVTFVVDNPVLPSPQDCLTRVTAFNWINSHINKKIQECYLPINKHLELTKVYRQLLDNIKLKHPDSVQIFDTTKYMCNIDKDVCESNDNGRLLYSYTDHISAFAAAKIGQDLNLLLNKQH